MTNIMVAIAVITITTLTIICIIASIVYNAMLSIS